MPKSLEYPTYVNSKQIRSFDEFESFLNGGEDSYIDSMAMRMYYDVNPHRSTCMRLSDFLSTVEKSECKFHWDDDLIYKWDALLRKKELQAYMRLPVSILSGLADKVLKRLNYLGVNKLKKRMLARDQWLSNSITPEDFTSLCRKLEAIRDDVEEKAISVSLSEI